MAAKKSKSSSNCKIIIKTESNLLDKLAEFMKNKEFIIFDKNYKILIKDESGYWKEW